MADSHFPNTGASSIIVTHTPLAGDGSEGDPATLPTSAQPVIANLGVGDLAVINEDPIFGTPAQIGAVVGTTYTDTSLTAYGAYTAMSVEPSADGAGIAIGQEVLLNEPDTADHSMSQFYGQETFVYHRSTQGAVSAIGVNATVQWFAGDVSASLTAYNAQVTNEGAGAVTNSLRGLGVLCANAGAGTATNIEGIKISTPIGDGVTNVYGLRILDQTFTGATINRAIDVNGTFIVGADGSTVSVNGTVQAAYKSADASTGITQDVTTGTLVGKTMTFKNGILVGFA